MDYIVKFIDKKFDSVEEWLDEIKSDFRFQINDKIIITSGSFESNLFIRDKDGGNMALKEVVESIHSGGFEKEINDRLNSINEAISSLVESCVGVVERLEMARELIRSSDKFDRDIRMAALEKVIAKHLHQVESLKGIRLVLQGVKKILSPGSGGGH